jgi:hypothetical protein
VPLFIGSREELTLAEEFIRGHRAAEAPAAAPSRG